MRRYGAFEIAQGVGARHEVPVPDEELQDLHITENGRVYTATTELANPNVVPMRMPEPDDAGRRPVSVDFDGAILRGFPTPSGRLEFYSSTLADWGWPEHALPGYIKSHIRPERLDPDQSVLLSTFRLPTQIHTRLVRFNRPSQHRAGLLPSLGVGDPHDAGAEAFWARMQVELLDRQLIRSGTFTRQALSRLSRPRATMSL